MAGEHGTQDIKDLTAWLEADVNGGGIMGQCGGAGWYARWRINAA